MKNFTKKLTLFVAIATVATSSVFATQNDVTAQVAAIGAAIKAAQPEIAEAVAKNAAKSSWFRLPTMTKVSLPTFAEAQTGLVGAVTTAGTFVKETAKTGYSVSVSGLSTAANATIAGTKSAYNATAAGLSTAANATVAGTKSAYNATAAATLAAVNKLPSTEVVKSAVVETTSKAAANIVSKKEVIGFVGFATLASYILRRMHVALEAKLAEEKTAAQVAELKSARAGK